MSTPPVPPPQDNAKDNSKDTKDDVKKKDESLRTATGKSLNKLSTKQQWEIFGIREKDHKMKQALKYVLSPKLKNKILEFFFFERDDAITDVSISPKIF